MCIISFWAYNVHEADYNLFPKLLNNTDAWEFSFTYSQFIAALAACSVNKWHMYVRSMTSFLDEEMYSQKRQAHNLEWHFILRYASGSHFDNFWGTGGDFPDLKLCDLKEPQGMLNEPSRYIS
jgi:hypothetical protein